MTGRLIDADDLLIRLKKIYEIYEESKSYNELSGLAVAYDMVQGQPTVEAVPISFIEGRIKDCEITRFLSVAHTLRALIETWNDAKAELERKEERQLSSEKTCYNCKHGAYGFDGDLGCSLWQRGIPNAEDCDYWSGIDRKEE